MEIESAIAVNTNLMHWIDNPVDARISANGLMAGINKDDFKVFVCRILVDPV